MSPWLGPVCQQKDAWHWLLSPAPASRWQVPAEGGKCHRRATLTKPAGPSLLRAGLKWHALWIPALCCPVHLVWVSRFLALLTSAVFLYSSIPFHSTLALVSRSSDLSQKNLPAGPYLVQCHQICFDSPSAPLFWQPLRSWLYHHSVGKENKEEKMYFPSVYKPFILCATKKFWPWIQDNLKLLTPATNDKGTWIKAMTLL